MQLPILNSLTGTDRNELIHSYIVAKQALQQAMVAMSSVWPHGRDYQGGDINVAMREHGERCAAVRKVIAELEVIVESIV